LNPEQWGSTLVKEQRYQEENPVTRDVIMMMLMMIMIIIIIIMWVLKTYDKNMWIEFEWFRGLPLVVLRKQGKEKYCYIQRGNTLTI